MREWLRRDWLGTSRQWRFSSDGTEAGHSFRARRNATRVPRDCTPVRRRLSRRLEVFGIVAVSPAGRLVAWHLDGSVKGSDTCRTLQHSRRRRARRFLVIWDPGRAHDECGADLSGDATLRLRHGYSPGV